MANRIKILFKDYPSGSWQDWSEYLINPPTISRKIESENIGEAGLIVFDSADIRLRYEGNVYNYFSIDLSSKQRYLIRISYVKSNNNIEQLYEGVVDFSSIKWDEYNKTISFVILDKIASASIIDNIIPQRQSTTFNSRTTADYIYMFSGRGSNGQYPGHDWNSFGNCGDESILVSFQSNQQTYWGDPINQSQPIVNIGETIEDITGTKWFIKDAWLAQVPNTIANTIGYYVYATWVRLIKIQEADFRAFGLNNLIYYSNYYNETNNFIDIIGSQDANGRYPIIAFDALNIFIAIIKRIWPEITVINNLGNSQFPIPLGYYTDLLDYQPFNKEPLDALKMLADLMQAYIYIDRNGNLVITKKDNLYGIVRNINIFIEGPEHTLFWDKLCDGVKVEVKSHLYDENGNNLIGIAEVTKQVAGFGGSNIKPRNQLVKEILVSDLNINTQESLNNYAQQRAYELINFYGKRHTAFEFTTIINDDTLQWELTDNIYIKSIRCYITNLDISLINNTIKVKAVEIEGHDYDIRQLIYGRSENNYYTTTQQGTTYITGGSNYLFNYPLNNNNNSITLQITDNLKITDNKLDTTQSIKKTAEIEFAKIGIGGTPDTVNKVKIYGNAWITGNIIIDGDIYIGGNINQINTTELNIIDKIIRLNKQGDNITAINAGIEILGSNDEVLASLKYNGNDWVSNINVNLVQGKSFKINNNVILNETTLGSSVIYSNLQQVGTITQGIWNATPINGNYINYNPTNLKVTSNQLNTIQDISTISTPSFIQINITNQATNLNHVVKADRTINTTLPLVGGSNLTNDINLSIAYNSQHFTLLNNQLAAQNINVSTTTGMVVTSPFTLGSNITINTPQDLRTSASPTFNNLTLAGRIDQQGTTNSEFASNYLLPKQSYYGNLGSINKKWLTLHAAELWVETLVAQNTIATIGGRILVGPTTTLISDLSYSSTTINVKHNNLSYNDIIYMEADGKIEFMRVNSSASGSAGNYYYSVIRDLDGTGANDWYAGDAIFNTGQAGSGFIDLYSIRGIKSSSQLGPTIVGNVRNSLTYNDWTEHWAIGNLNGLYGYSSNIYGVGLGRYANSNAFITIDSSNGIRIRYRNSSGSISDKVILDTSGNLIIAGYLQVGMAAQDVNNGTTTISGSKITTGTITLSHLNFTPATQSNIIATINSSTEGIRISASKIQIDGNVIFSSGYDPSTKIPIGGAAQDVNNGTTTISGSKIRTGIIQSDNYSSTSGTYFDLTNGNLQINALRGSVALIGTMVNYSFGLQVVGKDISGNNKILVQAGSYNDNSTSRYGFSIWDNTQNAFIMNIGYEPNSNTYKAIISNWNITKDWLADNDQKIVLNATQKSIYARPLGTGTATKYVMLGQTHDGNNWTGYYGISAVDGNNNFIFRIDDYEKKIAGWNFDYQKFFNQYNSQYVGVQVPLSTTTKVFYAGASDSIGTNAKFYVQSNGKVVTTDQNGNILFDSEQAFHDSKNIGRVFFSTVNTYIITATAYTPITQGSLFLLPNENTVQAIFRAWINGNTTSTGKVRLKLERTNQYPTNNADIPNYDTTIYSNEVQVGDGYTSCFDYNNTEILTPEGYKKIKELKVGDIIISFNERLNAFEKDIINQIIISETEEYYELNDGTKVTGEHPFYCRINNIKGYMKVKDLFIMPEAEVYKYNGWSKISIVKINNKLKVATLRTNKNTFIANGYIVHNKGVTQAYALFGVCKITSGISSERLYRWTLEGFTYNSSYPLKIDNLCIVTGRSTFSQVLVTAGF
ncbi:MAG: Hint domain-containing protein [Candidatus Pacearchaeota archaeon]